MSAAHRAGRRLSHDPAGPIDERVGANIRTCRQRRGVSQAELGRAIGVTFQQVQKYESGTNRISAGRLLLVSQFFDIPLSALFEAN